MPAPELSRADVAAFLAGRHREAVEDLEPLGGGFWSAAFAYRAGGRELVVRFGADAAWFEADRRALAHAGPDLPVPEVVEVGSALGGAYAISVRHHGGYLEDVRPDQAAAAGPMLGRLLGALRAVPAPAGAPVDWHAAVPVPGLTWREWLADGLVDDPSRPVHGWRARLEDDPAIARLYRAGGARVRGLLDACPERRDLVHGDLLHANVLVSADASRVTAVFSWKCSVRGDFLYDTAWCSFWSAWYPGIAAVEPWQLTLTGPGSAADLEAPGDPGALADAGARHHCYQLHIGLVHLGWSVWVGDEAALGAVARHLETVLEAGAGL